MLWDDDLPRPPPDRDLADGEVLTVGGVDLQVLHTPGHSPGSSASTRRSSARSFSGDTLFKGGPGATGRSFSDFRHDHRVDPRPAADPAAARPSVHTGHGDSTTIGAEAPHLRGVDRPRD